MSAAKKATKHQNEEPEASKADSEDSGTSTEVAVAPAKEAAAAPRKSLGPKEPPAFLWKLIGHSGGMAVTLFKAAEREDIEAQFERLRKEGYYADLRIVDINEKVVHPNPPAPPKKPAKRAAKEKKAPSKSSGSSSRPSKTSRRAGQGATEGASSRSKRPSRAKSKADSPKSTKKAGAAKTARRSIKKKK